jgi:hypothetical protein
LLIPGLTELIGACWIWSTIEPTIGILCACLPAMRPVMQVLFGRFSGDSSTGGTSDSGHLVTIGSSGAKTVAKSRCSITDGHFRVLSDNDSAEDPVLWPEQYNNERHVIVEGSRPDSVPMEAIRVQKDMTWTETTLPKRENI